MAEQDFSKKEKNYFTDIPQKSEAFFLKGSNAYDWGMKNRLARIFNPQSGKTVMLAFDHGYFQGPTTGLERIDVTILPLVPYADALMLTRGILRTVIPPPSANAVVMRASGGPSILKELSERADRRGHGRRAPHERVRRRRAGLHRRRIRDPVGATT